MARDLASEAVAAQRTAGYQADVWLNVNVEPILKLWRGIDDNDNSDSDSDSDSRRKSNFFFSEEDARMATGAYVGSSPHQFAQTLWRMAQVQPHPTLGFRDGIREYVVDLRTAAAISVCIANPALGGGSVFQYYVPNWQRLLRPTGRTFKFAQKKLPEARA
jgi:hypothetical protein